MELPVNYNKTKGKKRKLVREEYVLIQDGKCCHCGEPLDGSPAQEVTDYKIDKSLFPIGMFNHPVHLHHNHNTGMTIGAIHAQCNAYLWQYQGE